MQSLTRRKKSFVTHVDPDIHRKLRIASTLLDKTIQGIIEEALTQYFERHGLTPKLEQILNNTTS